MRLWDVSASVLVLLDVTFEAVFTDAKLQECPEISVLHLKPPHICAVRACTCILAIPKGQNSTRSWNQQVCWCVIAHLWAFTAGGAWTTAWRRRCTRRTFHNFIKSHTRVLQIRAGLIILFYLNITPVTALCRRLSSATILKVFKGSLMTQRAREWHFCRAHFKLAVNNNDRRGIHLLSCHTDNNKYSEYVRYAFESSWRSFLSSFRVKCTAGTKWGFWLLVSNWKLRR